MSFLPKLTLASVAMGMALASTFAVTADASGLNLKSRTNDDRGGIITGGGNGGGGGAGGAAAGATATFTSQFNPNCAGGFSKAGEKEVANIGWTDWYVCSTPVIVCPKQVQKDDGRISHVTPKVLIQQTGGDPDGGTVSFRVQYQCDYSYNAPPEG